MQAQGMAVHGSVQRADQEAVHWYTAWGSSGLHTNHPSIQPLAQHAPSHHTAQQPSHITQHYRCAAAHPPTAHQHTTNITTAYHCSKLHHTVPRCNCTTPHHATPHRTTPYHTTQHQLPLNHIRLVNCSAPPCTLLPCPLQLPLVPIHTCIRCGGR